MDRERSRCPEHLTCPPHRSNLGCPSCNPAAANRPSELLHQLAHPDAQSVRDALLAVAADEDEQAELNRIYNNIGSPPGSPDAAATRPVFDDEPADSSWLDGSQQETVKLEFEINLKGVTVSAEGLASSGCSARRCTGLQPPGTPTVLSVDRSMPAGAQALQWLSAGARERHQSGECAGQCGCCIAVYAPGQSGDFIRHYLSQRASIGVTSRHSSSAAAAKVLLPPLL